MREQRRFVRIPESTTVTYRLATAAKMSDFLIKDLSVGGIRFYVHEFIPKGSVLKIGMTIGKEHFTFEAMVRVVWIKDDSRSQRYEVGAEFIEMTAEASNYLLQYIKATLKLNS